MVLKKKREVSSVCKGLQVPFFNSFFLLVYNIEEFENRKTKKKDRKCIESVKATSTKQLCHFSGF